MTIVSAAASAPLAYYQGQPGGVSSRRRWRYEYDWHKKPQHCRCGNQKVVWSQAKRPKMLVPAWRRQEAWTTGDMKGVFKGGSCPARILKSEVSIASNVSAQVARRLSRCLKPHHVPHSGKYSFVRKQLLADAVLGFRRTLYRRFLLPLR
jgi:hypothetical protein